MAENQPAKPDPQIEAIERQNAEFTAVGMLVNRYNCLMNTPVVDDDYPEVRHYYESAMMQALDAIAKNRPDMFELALRRVRS